MVHLVFSMWFLVAVRSNENNMNPSSFYLTFHLIFVFHLLLRCICYLQNCDINLIRNNSNGHSMHFSELTSTYILESAMAVRCA